MKKLIALTMMLLLVVGSFAACGGVESELKGLVSDLEDAINDKDGEKLLELFVPDKMMEELEGQIDADEFSDLLMTTMTEQLGDEDVKIEVVGYTEYEGDEFDEKAKEYEGAEMEIDAYAEIEIKSEYDGETSETEIEAYKYDGKWYFGQ